MVLTVLLWNEGRGVGTRRSKDTMVDAGKCASTGRSRLGYIDWPVARYIGWPVVLYIDGLVVLYIDGPVVLYCGLVVDGCLLPLQFQSHSSAYAKYR